MTTYASASLYVGDLEQGVQEALLHEIFKEAGPIVSIRVCRDAITRKSLGYAYVNFQQPEDAERALETLNYCKIHGKAIRIMWSQRDPSLRKSGAGNVFIKNLDKEIDNQALRDTFSVFGKILSCKVSTNKDGESNGYGFVHFETQKAADDAINKVNGMLINNKQVYVGRFQKKKPSQEFTNVFTKNIPTTWDEKKIEEELKKVGPVKSFIVSENTLKGVTKKFALCNYVNHGDAVKAIEELNDKEVESGEKLFVTKAMSKSERKKHLADKYEKIRAARASKSQGLNLYVKNFGEDMDEEGLRKLFSEYGEITSLKIMRDESNESKGFGFVCFKTAQEASAAKEGLSGKLRSDKPLYVAFHQPKQIRQQQLREKFRQAQVIHPGMMTSFPNPVFYQHQAQHNVPFRTVYAPRQPQISPKWQQQQQQNGRQQFKKNHPRRNEQVRFNQGARNAPAEQVPPRPVNQISSQELANMSENERKNYLGTQLFTRISERNPSANVGKITGMLLEMDPSDILHLLESPQNLDQKIREAVELLEKNKNDA